jgi:adenylate cyclase
MAGDGIAALSEWLLAEGLVADDLAGYFGEFCRRVAALGVPLQRGRISMPARAPDIESLGCSWWPDGRIVYEEFPHGGYDQEPFLSSPLRHMIEERLPQLRRRLEGPDARLDFRVLHELRAEGVTDYVARLHAFQREFRGLGRSVGIEGAISTWTTDRPGGFSEAEIAIIDRLLPALLLGIHRIALHKLATDLLGAYVGLDAGRRVLMGETQRGKVERRSAVLLLSDLRGFTALADRVPGETVVGLLDECFEATAAPIEAAGGEILKFLGDGLLAMFPLDAEDAHAVAASALGAARQILGRMAAQNRERGAAGGEALILDLVLHLGTVMYGNVGSARRVDFTVIGPAVNEASRIEQLCEPLGRQLLVSESFAAAHPSGLVSLGRHALRGVAHTQEIFGLAEAAR